MKYAVFLVAATMGSCLPQFPSGQKLPFKPAPEKSGIWCPIKSYDEDGCGTKRYCQAIDMIGQVLVHPGSTLNPFGTLPRPALMRMSKSLRKMASALFTLALVPAPTAPTDMEA